MNKIKQVFSHDSDSTNTAGASTRSDSGIKGSHAVQSDRDRINGTAGPTVNSDLNNQDSTGTTGGRLSNPEPAPLGGAGNTSSTTGTNATGAHHLGVSSEARQAENKGDSLVQHANPPLPGHHHDRSEAVLDERGAADATHDRQHVAPVTHQEHHHHETEEVQRQTEIEKHHHHVQHHVQPVLDTHHADVQHHDQVHPVSHIQEQHVNTDADRTAFAGLNKHQDEYTHAGKERTVVDKGEVVNQHDHHHVHHVVQPIIKRDTHEHHVHHTTIPTHHKVHEAPVVHESVSHEPMHLKDFVSGGGDLKSKLTHDQAGVLNNGECERTTDGPLESLKEKLHLGGTQSSNVKPTGASAGAGVNTGNADAQTA